MNEAQRIVDALLEFMDEHPLPEPEPPGGPGRHSLRMPSLDPDHDIMISTLKQLYPDGIPQDVLDEIMGPDVGPGPDDELPGNDRFKWTPPQS